MNRENFIEILAISFLVTMLASVGIGLVGVFTGVLCNLS